MKMADLYALEDKLAGSPPSTTECGVIDMATWSPLEQFAVISATPVGMTLLLCVYVWVCWKAVNGLHWIAGKLWALRFAPVQPTPPPEGYEVMAAEEWLDTLYDQIYDLRTALCLGRNDVARERVEQMLHELEAA